VTRSCPSSRRISQRRPCAFVESGTRVASTRAPTCGTRHTNPPADLYESKQFRQGFGRLSGLGLTFEAWQYHPQMPMVTALAKAFPDTTIVLNHFGGPLGIGPYEGRRTEIFGAWKANITELARCPNVVVKLGGINMPVNGFGWHRLPSTPTSDQLGIRDARLLPARDSTSSARDDACSRATSR